MKRPAHCPLALLAFAWMWASGALACSSGPKAPVVDAAADAGEPVDAVSDDAQPVVLAVDFTAMGCGSYDVAKPQCRGTAPLTLAFVPITSGAITRFLWTFGDGSESSERTPTHTYTLPGTYNVQLIGTPGLPFQPHDGFVVVEPNGLGDGCDVDSQCERGTQLSCVCGSGCTAAFARGICTKRCAQAACPAQAVCADLSLGAAAGTTDAWRASLCLRACTKDDECPLGQRCRSVPAADAPGQWTRACFVAFPGDLGAGCRGGNGELQDDLCLGGRCADLGALGVCSIDCSQKACPAGTACAAFGDGRRRCLKPCADASPCHDDPLLDCVPSGGGGPLGFAVEGATATATFCAPKTCDADAVCAPAGTCVGQPTGHCVRPAPTRP
jgi:hypothetical protein